MFIRLIRALRKRRGSATIIVIILLLVIIGAAALVVDLGNLFRIRNELQTSADAAALAGAQYLDGTSQGIDDARQGAIDFAARNVANGTSVNILHEDIVFGSWNPLTDVFTPAGSEPDDPAIINAIQILTQRSQNRGDPIELTFAPIFGNPDADIQTDAIAVGGGPSTIECAFPLVVSDCSLKNADIHGKCEYCLQFQNNNSDTAGWTGFRANGGLGNPNIADLVLEGCYQDGNVALDANDECSGNFCGEQTISTQIQVGNGNFLNTGNNSCLNGPMTGCNNPCPIIQDILTRGGTTPPTSFNVKVPILQSDPGTCSADQYSGKKTISGFAALKIFGAKCGNNDPEVLDTNFPSFCPPPPSGDYVAAVLDCDSVPAGTGGGGFYGLDALHFRLVE